MIGFYSCIASWGQIGICLLLTGSVVASDQDRDRDRDRLYDQSSDQDRDRLREREHSNDDDKVYGSQLMTERERYQYREQLRSMQTLEQREQFRRQHHEKMQKRAIARGVTLPDYPPEPRHNGWGGAGFGGGKSGRK